MFRKGIFHGDICERFCSDHPRKIVVTGGGTDFHYAKEVVFKAEMGGIHGTYDGRHFGKPFNVFVKGYAADTERGSNTRQTRLPPLSVDRNTYPNVKKFTRMVSSFLRENMGLSAFGENPFKDVFSDEKIWHLSDDASGNNCNFNILLAVLLF